MRKLKKPAKGNPFRKVSSVGEDATLIVQGWMREADQKIIKKQGREGSAVKEAQGAKNK